MILSRDVAETRQIEERCGRPVSSSMRAIDNSMSASRPTLAADLKRGGRKHLRQEQRVADDLDPVISPILAARLALDEPERGPPVAPLDEDEVDRAL